MAHHVQSSGFSFSVGKECSNKLLPTTSSKEAMNSKLGYSPESISDNDGCMVEYMFSEMNSFVKAVHAAFASHYPLILSPDMVWLCIMQGFSAHVNRNAEKLRKKFVSHEGKVEIGVRRDDFVKGEQNPWQEAFSEFSEKIRDHIGSETHSIIVPNFSTTGPIEKAVSEIVLMETVQNYFRLDFYTLCGIPEFTLEGTAEDWQQLRDKAAKLSQFDLEWWIPHLLVVLDQIVAARLGKVDKAFWSSIYKIYDASGGPYISGWILKLFPYLDGKRNAWLEEEPGRFSGPVTSSFPSGLSRAPFTWHYLVTDFKMDFIGGFVGVKQDPQSLALRPEMGWAVVEQSKSDSGA